MTARSRAAATASLMGAVWGCGANGEPTAAVIAVSPPMAYSDTASSLVIEGGPFRPAYRFDSMSGQSSTDVGAFSARLIPASGTAGATSAPIDLAPVSWLSIGLLTATLPSGIPAGAYDVEVTDPRGQHTSLHAAFLSLGPDHDPPAVTIQAPRARSIIGAQTTVTVTLTADDGAGQLASLDATVATATTTFTSTCTVPPATAATICHFQFTAPAPSGPDDMVVIEAHAMDSVGNPAVARASFRLAPQPTLTGLAPTVGPASGGTAIDIHGTDSVAPTYAADGSPLLDGSQLLIDGVPVDPVANAVLVVSSTEMTAIMSSHDPGYAKLTVATGQAVTDAMYFEFFPAPVVRLVSPNRGPLSGGTAVAIVGDHFRNGPDNTIWIGPNLLVNPCFVSANRIEGFVPAALDSGSVTVVAHDSIGGDGMLVDAFTYDPGATDAPDGGVQTTSCGGTP